MTVSAIGTKRTFVFALRMSAFGAKRTSVPLQRKSSLPVFEPAARTTSLAECFTTGKEILAGTYVRLADQSAEIRQPKKPAHITICWIVREPCGPRVPSKLEP